MTAGFAERIALVCNGTAVPACRRGTGTVVLVLGAGGVPVQWYWYWVSNVPSSRWRTDFHAWLLIAVYTRNVFDYFLMWLKHSNTSKQTPLAL